MTFYFFSLLYEPEVIFCKEIPGRRVTVKNDNFEKPLNLM